MSLIRVFASAAPARRFSFWVLLLGLSLPGCHRFASDAVSAPPQAASQGGVKKVDAHSPANSPANLPLAAAVASAVAPATAPANSTVRLIALNDFHGNLEPPSEGVWLPDVSGNQPVSRVASGGAAYLSHAVQVLEAEYPAHSVVAAGDLVGASPLTSALFHDEPTVDFMSQLGLRFSSVGNHEFDKGLTELRRKQQGGCFPKGVPGKDTCVIGPFQGAQYQYLAANVIDHASGQSIFPGSGIQEFSLDGHVVKVGFIGLVVRDTPSLVSPSGVVGLDFIDEADAANAQLGDLRARGASVFVVLIHQGGQTAGSFRDGPEASSWFDDPRCPGFSGELIPILQKLDPAIRIVISGHTHQAYVCQIDGRLVTSAGSYGRVLTAIDLQVNPSTGELIESRADNKLVVSASAKVAPAKPAGAADLAVMPAALAQEINGEPDPKIAAFVDEYRRRAQPLTERVIGRVTADLPNSLSAQPTGETPAGDVVADAMLEATRAVGAQLAFVNLGSVRTPLHFDNNASGEAPGEVTFAEAYAMQPFGNNLITMTLSGAQIATLLAQQWVSPQSGPNGAPNSAPKKTHWLQPSHGLRYRWDASRPDDTDKVIAGSITINGRPLQMHRNYRVTVNDFMAAGGDGSKVLLAGRDAVVGVKDNEALMSYFERHSPVAPPPQKRIVRVH